VEATQGEAGLPSAGQGQLGSIIDCHGRVVRSVDGMGRRRIVVTETDLTRLTNLMKVQPKRNADACEGLEAELARANVVLPGEIPADVVTMNSRARFVVEDRNEEIEMTLVYPRDADVDRGLSVGARTRRSGPPWAVGQSIEWPLPRGGTRRLRGSAVVYHRRPRGSCTCSHRCVETCCWCAGAGPPTDARLGALGRDRP
jgi:regulator of nucleoside diphosphate kinase